MNDGYYKELINEIKRSINNKEYKLADKLINDELNMPYVPEDVESQLYSLQNELKYFMSETKNASEDEILGNLLKKGEVQLKAVDDLTKLNLRNYLAEIQMFFDSAPDILVQVLMIDSLISQQINHEFKVIIEEKIHLLNFIDEVQGIKSNGFISIDSILRDTLIDNDPSTYKLCRELLIQECFIRTPFNIDPDECEDFASEIAWTVMKMLSINPTEYGFKKQNNKNVYLKCLKVAF